MQRAHSIVTIKRADTEARRFTGIASTPATDRDGDVLDPMGARFKLPFPLLLGHDHNAPIGEVIEARATAAGIYVVCQCAPDGTTAKSDEGWRAIRSGLIRGLSVGFIGKDWDALPTGGRRFKEWEVVELSAVTVPANADAAILEVKRLDGGHAPSADVVPPYPAHLSPAERQAVLEKAARALYEASASQAAKGMNTTLQAMRQKLGPAHEVEQLDKIEGMILRRWQSERLTALEAAVAHLGARHGG